MGEGDDVVHLCILACIGEVSMALGTLVVCTVQGLPPCPFPLFLDVEGIALGHVSRGTVVGRISQKIGSLEQRKDGISC